MKLKRIFTSGKGNAIWNTLILLVYYNRSHIILAAREQDKITLNLNNALQQPNLTNLRLSKIHA
jgi:hypothetical protein